MSFFEMIHLLVSHFQRFCPIVDANNVGIAFDITSIISITYNYHYVKRGAMSLYSSLSLRRWVERCKRKKV